MELSDLLSQQRMTNKVFSDRMCQPERRKSTNNVEKLACGGPLVLKWHVNCPFVRSSSSPSRTKCLVLEAQLTLAEFQEYSNDLFVRPLSISDAFARSTCIFARVVCTGSFSTTTPFVFSTYPSVQVPVV